MLVFLVYLVLLWCLYVATRNNWFGRVGRSVNKPSTFEDAKELIGHPDLHEMLDQMLIFLALGQSTNETVRFRAIELLLMRPLRDVPNVLDQLAVDELLELDKEMDVIIDRYLGTDEFITEK